MKRSFSFSTALTAGAITLITAVPAFAEDYAYSTGDDAAEAVFGTGVCAVYACIGVFAVVSFAFWIWMLIDVFARQEYEFPNSTGNSKVIWLVVMFASWVLSAPLIAAIVYYFMVYKKIKRGTTAPSAGSVSPVGYQPPPAPPVAPAPPAPPVAPPAPPVAPAPPAPPVPPAPQSPEE